MLPKPKNTGKELRKTKETLVRVFNQWVRLKETDEYGAGRCFSCRRVVGGDQAQAGHFVRCGKEATRFDERNVHVQCQDCNIIKGGNREMYAKALNLSYGPGTALELQTKGEVIHLWTIEDLKALLRQYRAKVKALLQEKYLD